MASKETTPVKSPSPAGRQWSAGGSPVGEEEATTPEVQSDGGDDEGLLSTTPSSIQQGPYVAQLEHHMTVIANLRRENTELRNHLDDQNSLIESKSKNLEQINDNYRRYDELVKQKHRETAEKFRAMREQYDKLKNELDQGRDGVSGATGGTEGDHEEVEMGSWTAVERKQEHHTDNEFDTVNQELTEEKRKGHDLSESLRKERSAKEAAEAKLNTAFGDLAKIREERKKENQELRKSLMTEVNQYKQQVQSLMVDLTESKRNLALHSKKVQELHEANVQFDEVNSAYHEKLAIYEEELKKRDEYLEKLKQEYYSCNQQLKQAMQRLQTEKHDKQVFEDEVGKLQEAVEHKTQQVQERDQEVDKLTARVYAVEESLEMRSRKIKENDDTKNMLELQLKQYQADFEHERLARERTHQEARGNQQELETLRQRNKELQDTVDQYTQNRLHDFGRQLSTTTAVRPAFQPQTPPHVPFGGDQRGIDWDEQRHVGLAEQRQVDEQERHTCPMCQQEFSEPGSLQIHVQTHFDN